MPVEDTADLTAALAAVAVASKDMGGLKHPLIKAFFEGGVGAGRLSVLAGHPLGVDGVIAKRRNTPSAALKSSSASFPNGSPRSADKCDYEARANNILVEDDTAKGVHGERRDDPSRLGRFAADGHADDP